jgi:hypothetical protein
LKQSEANALWGRSGGRCAKCNTEILKTNTKGRAYPVGDHAHVVGKSRKGPRGDSAMSAKDRASADNHVLLCATCHREVDGDPVTWAVELLRTIKANHEERIRIVGEQIPMTDISGTFVIEAIDADTVIGADLESPTRLSGSRFRVSGKKVGQVTGVRVNVRR